MLSLSNRRSHASTMSGVVRVAQVQGVKLGTLVQQGFARRSGCRVARHSYRFYPYLLLRRATFDIARSAECPMRGTCRRASPQAAFGPFSPQVPKSLTLTSKPLQTQRCAQDKPGVESVSYPGSKNIDSWWRISNSTIRSSTPTLDGIRHERIDGKAVVYR
jgi:hypothetical protein